MCSNQYQNEIYLVLSRYKYTCIRPFRIHLDVGVVGSQNNRFIKTFNYMSMGVLRVSHN